MTVTNCMYHTVKGIPPTISKDPIDDLWDIYRDIWDILEVSSKKTFVFRHFAFCLLPLQINSHLPQFTSCIRNLNIACKTFNLTHQNMNNNTFETYPRYIVITERFWNRSNVNVIIELMKYCNKSNNLKLQS